MNLQAVARSVSGNIIAASPSVPFQIANGTTTLTLLSPTSSQTLSGTVNWNLQTDYAGSAPRMFYCFIDGMVFIQPYTQAPPFSVDTTQFPNGTHELFCALWAETTPISSLAMSQAQIRVDNGRVPMELRSNFRELYLVSGQSASLAAKRVYTNLDEDAATAVFRSADPTVATVDDSSGVVTAVAPGVTTITLTSGERRTVVRVIVNSAGAFPHFAKNGRLLDSFHPHSSTFLDTLFFLDANQLVHDGKLGGVLRQSAVTALTSGFYYNPADSSDKGDLYSWLDRMHVFLKNLDGVAGKNGLGIFLTGDDIARTNAELSDSVTTFPSREKIRYVFNWAKNTGRVMGVDMID